MIKCLNVQSIFWSVVFSAASLLTSISAHAQIDHISQEKKITCASNQYRRSTCDVGGIILQAQLIQQHSRTECIEGVSFGIDQTSIWVDKGCRATFIVDVAPDLDEGKTVACASIGNRPKSCAVARMFISGVELIRQDSRAACIEDYSFGFTDKAIWVKHGCRGLFRVYGMSPFSSLEDASSEQGAE